MKFVFVVSECENYAVMLFSAILKKNGHKPYIIFDPRLFANDEIRNNRLAKFFDIKKYNIEKIKQIRPDYICFSVYTQDYKWALDIARAIKAEMPNNIILFGGIHCILCPEEVIKEDCIDMVCVGEGEQTISQLGNTTFSDIANLWWKSDKIYKNSLVPLVQNLDSLPYLDRDIFYEQRPLFSRDYTISTGRGCPYQCTFCASTALKQIYPGQKFVRQRTPENILKELSEAKKKYNYRSIYFTDDVFTMNFKWLAEFAPAYKKLINKPFYCTANPGTIKDEELLLLKDMGCQMIGFGMQSCNEVIRKNLLKRTGTNKRIKEVANLCHKLKIHFSFDHIFEIPTESVSNQTEALKFYNETRPDVINTFDMTYLPKIELNKFLDEETKKEVESGKLRTGMFRLGTDCYSSLFSLLPLVPSKFIDWLIRKNLAKFIRFPYIIRLILKDIKRLKIGRYSDVFFPIQLLFINMFEILKLKCKIKSV